MTTPPVLPAAGSSVLPLELTEPPPGVEGLPVALKPLDDSDPDEDYLIRSGALHMLQAALDQVIASRSPDPAAAMCAALRKRQLPLLSSDLLVFIEQAGAQDVAVTLDVLAASSPPAAEPWSSYHDDLHASAAAAADLLLDAAAHAGHGDGAAAYLHTQFRRSTASLPRLAYMLAAAKMDFWAALSGGGGVTPVQTPRAVSPGAAPAPEPVHVSVIVPVMPADAERINGGLLHRWVSQLSWLTALPSASARTTWRLCVADIETDAASASAATGVLAVVARRGGQDPVSVLTGSRTVGAAYHAGIAAATANVPDLVPPERHLIVLAESSESLHLCLAAPLVRAVLSATASSGITAAYAVPDDAVESPIWPYTSSLPHKTAIALLRRLAPAPLMYDAGDCYTRMLCVRQTALDTTAALHGPLLCKGAATCLMEVFARLALQADRDKRKVSPLQAVPLPHAPPHVPGALSPVPELDVVYWRQMGTSLVPEGFRRRKDDTSKWAEFLETADPSTFAALVESPSPVLATADSDKIVRSAAAIAIPSSR